MRCVTVAMIGLMVALSGPVMDQSGTRGGDDRREASPPHTWGMWELSQYINYYSGGERYPVPNAGVPVIIRNDFQIIEIQLRVPSWYYEDHLLNSNYAWLGVLGGDYDLFWKFDYGCYTAEGHTPICRHSEAEFRFVRLERIEITGAGIILFTYSCEDCTEHIAPDFPGWSYP